MRIISVVGAFAVALAIAFSAAPSYCQESDSKAAAAPEIAAVGAAPGADAAAQAPDEGLNVSAQEQQSASAGQASQPSAKELSVYGEVQSVNVANNMVTLQYYDYDSDEEKSIEIFIEATTKLENIAAVVDIKAGDWADVTYVIKDAKSIGKVVTVEKEETGTTEDTTAMDDISANE